MTGAQYLYINTKHVHRTRESWAASHAIKLLFAQNLSLKISK